MRNQTRTFLATLLFTCLVAVAPSFCHGQTNVPPPYTNAPTLSAGIKLMTDAISNGETNWLFEAHGLYAPSLAQKYGGGVGVLFPLSDYVVTGIRLDYVDGGFWMPSGNVGLQLPIKLPFLGLKVTPFGYAGIGVPVSGATFGSIQIPGRPPVDNNGQPTAIIGYGAALRLWTSADGSKLFDLAGDTESWSGFPGQQYRFAALFKWAF